MTLPEHCDTCGQAIHPWDPEEDCICNNCGSTVATWEHLDPAQVHRRMRLIALRDRIERAKTVPVQETFL